MLMPRLLIIRTTAAKQTVELIIVVHVMPPAVNSLRGNHTCYKHTHIHKHTHTHIRNSLQDKSNFNKPGTY